MNPVEPLAEALARLLEIVVRLQPHPQRLRHAEVLRQPQRGVRRNRTLSLHNFIDAPWRNSDFARDLVLADLHGL